MISFRQHVLTVVALFLALAVGVVLGGGPLSEVGDDTTPTAADTGTRGSDDPAAAYTEQFAAAVSPGLVAGRLADRQVAVVTMPGADETLVTALTEQVVAAGGSVTGRYRLTEEMVDPSQKSLVDTLGSQLMTQQPEGAVDPASSTYDRMGELLGLAVAATEAEGAGLTGKTRAVAEAVAGAELMEPVDGVERRAPLVLVVLGDEPAAEGGDTILAGLVSGLAREAVGVVVAGTVADGGDGQLGTLRADAAASQVATVDGIDSPAGRTATVLALARALTVKGGAFGASGSDGPAPVG